MSGCCGGGFVPDEGLAGADGADGGVALSAGTQSASSGTVVFANSNAVTFGMSGSSQVTASFAAIKSVSGGTTFASGAGISFANGSGVSFGVNGNTITASVAVVAPGISSLSAGTTNATGPGVSFANGSGVSFGANGNTITASVAAGATATGNVGALAAGSQTGSSGTIFFSNQNDLTWGMNASSRITASFAAIKSLSAGTTHATGVGVSFANGSGVSFGVNGNTITASVDAVAIKSVIVHGEAFSSTLSGQTITFSNATGVNQGSWLVPAPNVLQFSIPVANFIAGISAGANSFTSGIVSFANGNGFTWSLESTAGQQVFLSYVDPFSYSQFSPYLDQSWLSNEQPGSVHIQPLQIPNVTFSLLAFPIQFNHNVLSTGTMTATINFGFYTKNVSTLSRLHSTSITLTAAYSTNASNSLFDGLRLVTLPWTSSLSRGDYWCGFQYASTTSSQDATFGVWVVPMAGTVLSGPFGAASATNNQMQIGQGQYSVTTAALPASIGFSEIRGTQVAARRPPIWTLGITA